MSATIYDIARLTGYNPGTVSRALNDDPRVRAKTREKIREVGNLLGYVPNLAAKSLITGRTKIIAVVSGSSSSGPMSALMLSLNKVLIQHDYLLMSLIYNSREQFQRCLARLRSGFCDGAILLSPTPEFTDVPELEMLIKSKYPLVCYDQWVEGLAIPVITNHAEKSIIRMTEELQKNSIDGAFLHFQPNSVAAWRRKCTEKLLKKLKIPFTSDMTKISELTKKHKIKKLAIYSDSIHGLDKVTPLLPEDRDFSIIGGIFDSWNLMVPEYFSGLVLCSQDFDKESQVAVDLLFQMLAGKEVAPKPIYIPPKEILVPMKSKKI